jgi:hypothetical protein
MKNTKTVSLTAYSKALLTVLLAVVFSNTATFGQTGQTGTLIQDGASHEINKVGSFYTDYTIPSDGAYPYLTLTARGADGGKAWIEALEGFKYVVKRTGKGGQGATVTATFKIGTGIGELIPGSKLRTIIGVAGSSGRTCPRVLMKPNHPTGISWWWPVAAAAAQPERAAIPGTAFPARLPNADSLPIYGLMLIVEQLIMTKAKLGSRPPI